MLERLLNVMWLNDVYYIWMMKTLQENHEIETNFRNKK